MEALHVDGAQELVSEGEAACCIVANLTGPGLTTQGSYEGLVVLLGDQAGAVVV